MASRQQLHMRYNKEQNATCQASNASTSKQHPHGTACVSWKTCADDVFLRDICVNSDYTNTIQLISWFPYFPYRCVSHNHIKPEEQSKYFCVLSVSSIYTKCLSFLLQFLFCPRNNLIKGVITPKTPVPKVKWVFRPVICLLMESGGEAGQQPTRRGAFTLLNTHTGECVILFSFLCVNPWWSHQPFGNVYERML